jgi:hypothetical protein
MTQRQEHHVTSVQLWRSIMAENIVCFEVRLTQFLRFDIHTYTHWGDVCLVIKVRPEVLTVNSVRSITLAGSSLT